MYTVLCCGLAIEFTGCSFPSTGPICEVSYYVGSLPSCDYCLPIPPWQDPYFLYLKVELSRLSECEEITGGLQIDDDNLTSLAGLENLISVGGDLEIENNDALTSLTGLDNLTSVDEYLRITYNDLLATCQAEWRAYSSIGKSNIGGTIYIYGNDDAGTCE